MLAKGIFPIFAKNLATLLNKTSALISCRQIKDYE